jgi:protein-export membrane protein SecD
MTDSTQSGTTASEQRFIRRFYALAVLVVIALVGWFVFSNATSEGAKHPFRLGLDLAGGSHLVYEADTSNIEQQEVPELMSVLRDVIERRVNVFGVSEPVVQVERSSFAAEETVDRLVVELPGVTDVGEAVAEIGRTPLLEFRLVDQSALTATTTATGTDPFVDTGLTGRYLQSASLEFAGGQGGQLANEPIVSIVFNGEGGDLFESITRQNVGEQLAIFLDCELISSPRINEPIAGGRATISGGFSPDEARDLAQNLNFGALPVPIKLASTQTIGASLGAEIVEKGVVAGVVGLSLIIFFLIGWYRIFGVVAAIALVSYIGIMLTLFMLIPVTLTAAGLAAFVLSLGMAVDANVLVFERVKEEWRAGKQSDEAIRDGFARAWSAIRDGNVTSILSAVILFWFGTSLVKGFALVFGLGVIVSMLSALLVTRTLLLALPVANPQSAGVWSTLFSVGFHKSTK